MVSSKSRWYLREDECEADRTAATRKGLVVADRATGCVGVCPRISRGSDWTRTSVQGPASCTSSRPAVDRSNLPDICHVGAWSAGQSSRTSRGCSSVWARGARGVEEKCEGSSTQVAATHANHAWDSDVWPCRDTRSLGCASIRRSFLGRRP